MADAALQAAGGPARSGAARHPTAGSKEGVYIIATVATPQQKGGAKPIVALPNPFYQAYLGGAVLSGAEPLLVNAPASNGFLPDYRQPRRGDLEAADGRLSLLAGQSAGRDRRATTT